MKKLFMLWTLQSERSSGQFKVFLKIAKNTGYIPMAKYHIHQPRTLVILFKYRFRLCGNGNAKNNSPVSSFKTRFLNKTLMFSFFGNWLSVTKSRD